MRKPICFGFVFAAVAVAVAVGCGGGSSGSDGADSDSEIATSVVSGSLNNANGTTIGWNDLREPKPSAFELILDAVNPIGTAYAAQWMCTGDTLSPMFAGPG